MAPPSTCRNIMFHQSFIAADDWRLSEINPGDAGVFFFPTKDLSAEALILSHVRLPRGKL